MALIRRASDDGSGSNTELCHNVDRYLDNILDMARIEFEYGVSAKYFIRIHAKNYNAFSHRSIHIIKTITLELNHQIGLHFEPDFYDRGEIEKGLRKEAELLELVYGVPPVQHVSIHGSGPLATNHIPGDTRLYRWEDSRRDDGRKFIFDTFLSWRDGCMCRHVGRHPELLVLTQPYYWFWQSASENY
jgi:hypothetical protein